MIKKGLKVRVLTGKDKKKEGEVIEIERTNKKAKKEFLPMQPGDVEATEANTSALEDYINFKPKTPIKKGIKEFVDWYRNFYEV